MEKTVQDIIIRPIITEASMDALADRKYTFKVAKTANKIEIKKAVEQLFKDVKVEKVNTMNVRGRKKRMGRNEGYTTAWKKAIVTINKNPDDKKTKSSIEFFDGLY